MPRALFVLGIAALLSAALPAHALLGPGGPAPHVTTGSGTVTFTNFAAHWVCPGMEFHIQVAGVETALLTVQALHHDELNCNTMSYEYSIWPSLVDGSWAEGWHGYAVGADPPVVWPVWEVVIGPATDPANVYFWSFYEDDVGRPYLLEGFFAIKEQF